MLVSLSEMNRHARIYHIHNQSALFWLREDEKSRPVSVETGRPLVAAVASYCFTVPPEARPQFLPMFCITCWR